MLGFMTKTLMHVAKIMTIIKWIVVVKISCGLLMKANAEFVENHGIEIFLIKK